MLAGRHGRRSAGDTSTAGTSSVGSVELASTSTCERCVHVAIVSPGPRRPRSFSRAHRRRPSPSAGTVGRGSAHLDRRGRGGCARRIARSSPGGSPRTSTDGDRVVDTRCRSAAERRNRVDRGGPANARPAIRVPKRRAGSSRMVELGRSRRPRTRRARDRRRATRRWHLGMARRWTPPIRTADR